MIVLEIETPNAPEGIEARLNAVSEACCRAEGIAPMVCFGRLVDDEEIHRVNLAFRGVDRPTDVLSFPSISYPLGKTAKDMSKRLGRERDPESGLPHLGDFLISLPTAQRQANEYGHSLDRELCYLTAHSVFHLMGYDHMTEADKAIMRAVEELVMHAEEAHR